MGRSGEDTIYGGDGDDTSLTGGHNEDKVFGGSGDDLLVVQSKGEIKGGDTFDGGSGTDTLQLDKGASIPGGVTVTNVEVIHKYGSSDDDEALSGGDGDDRINGGGGRDNHFGGLGDDVFIVDSQGDLVDGEIFDGGPGTDTLVLEEGAYLTDDVTLISIEVLDRIGTGEKDRLTGDDRINAISGLSGRDRLYGLEADDGAFFGGQGVDALYGGKGADSGFYGGSAGDRIAGNQGADHGFYGDQGVDSLMGGRGSDSGFYGGLGDDEVRGGRGNDRGLFGDSGKDWLIGGNGRDRLYGGSMEDVLEGGSGIDRQFGGAGADTFVVASQGDILGGETYDGGAGSDTLQLGEEPPCRPASFSAASRSSSGSSPSACFDQSGPGAVQGIAALDKASPKAVRF